MKKAFSVILLIMVCLCCFATVPQAQAIISSGSSVHISYAGQVVDSITYKGIKVDAIYKPFTNNDEYNNNFTYSCAAFVKKFYNKIYGIEVENLYPGDTPRDKSGSGYFYKVTSPQVGDIAASSGHWAIVKAVNGSSATIIEQNCWNSDDQTQKTHAQVGRQVRVSGGKYWFWRYSGAETEITPVDLGTDFDALILNKNYWKPFACDSDNIVRSRNQNANSEQIWRFIRQSDNSYAILSNYNGNALQIYNGDRSVGTAISADKPFNGSDYQKWYICWQRDGYLLVSKADKSLVVDLSGNSQTTGTSIVSYTRNDTDAQIWAIWKMDGLGTPELTVTGGYCTEKTEFKWNDVDCETQYDLYIYDQNGKLVFSEGNVKSGVKIELTPNNYSAKLVARNYFNSKNSASVSFVQSASHRDSNKDSYCDSCQTRYAYGKGSCGDNVYWEFYYPGELIISGNGEMITDEREQRGWETPAIMGNVGWGIKKIVIKNGVTSIGNRAFSACVGVEHIEIPDSVTKIGANALSSLGGGGSTLVIPDSVTSIGEICFHHSGFKKIILSDNITELKRGTFSGSDIEEIVLPSKLKSIGEQCFYDCHSLEKIEIPESVESISGSAFDECEDLTIYAVKGSVAEKYAKEKGFDFVEVEKHIHTYTTTTTKATLAKNGKTVTKCSECGEVKSTTTVYYPKTITLSKTAYTYNGKAQKPTVTVKDSKGNTLKNGTDYKVTYEKGRKNPGKYTVRIDFMGKYSGTKRVYFTIAPAVPVLAKTSQSTNAIRLTWNKVTGATGYRVYQYNSKTKKWDKLKTLKDTTYRIEKLKAGTTYKFRVKAYKKDGETIWGKATSTITVATKPATPKITKLTTTKAKATFTWSNVSGESGYQVYYSTKKDSGFKKVATYKANVVKGSKSKLKSGKKYYFKVRAYKKTASGTVYSAWSAVKAVKIK